MKILSFGKTLEFNESKQINGDNIDSVQINVSSTDVQVTPSEDDQVHIQYYGEGNEKGIEGNELKIEQHGSTLSVHIKQKNSFGFHIMNTNLDIKLPLKSYKYINLDASSGDIEASEIQGEKISLSSSSGDIIATQIKSNVLSLKSSSGDVELKETKGNEINARTTSGDVVMNGCFAQKIQSSSMSGDVELKHSIAEHFQLQSTSGDVVGKEITGEIKASSTSGDIELRLQCKHDLFLETTSGDVSILTEDPSVKLAFQSDSGDYHGPNKWEHGKSVSMEYGKGEHFVQVRTRSGDFHFKIV